MSDWPASFYSEADAGKCKLLYPNVNFVYIHSFQGFLMRKSFFNAENTGYFKTEKRESNAKNPMTGMEMRVQSVNSSKYYINQANVSF